MWTLLLLVAPYTCGQATVTFFPSVFCQENIVRMIYFEVVQAFYPDIFTMSKSGTENKMHNFSE